MQLYWSEVVECHHLQIVLDFSLLTVVYSKKNLSV